MKNRLLVSNLPASATPEALRVLFAELGHSVETIDFGPNEKWHLPHGYAIVTLSPRVDPAKAIQDTDGSEFQGRILRVNGARPLKSRHRSDRAA